ncbi:MULTISPECIES: hypothetical protein [Idiomarina]|jgi:hypothetical protein|uniref:Uncharacterized protein n=4 Tax=Idiomarina TaxID=135575 RepID=A0A432ZBT6_9GAMM|nr:MULTISPECIES: hypothetical protein [Idiomarina]MEC7643543.1 hypothetical protein [Pseudomonadota bacterium]HBY41050.1 hypothetical protein [Alteromonas sp.]AGM36505.1 hypothetical protein K734_08220 [Idiomarina loihiensis GSL 199]AVJ56632.1 hypothetical protein C5610_10245 [Idiomarina sp. OT37-5b]EAQ32842.1 hypothetical protein OS145_01747 [Idiomarina baltica OS145]|tara:strand:- start:2312 stop:2635 length:324 start_codon:yes stop_codon:yes gene_type:complete
MKISWFLILTVLIHSSFACAPVAGTFSQSSIKSAGVAYDLVLEIERENQDLNKSIYDSKQQTQPHISCITGYNLLISAVPVILAPNSNSVGFDQSLTHQPPVPPPNA